VFDTDSLSDGGLIQYALQVLCFPGEGSYGGLPAFPAPAAAIGYQATGVHGAVFGPSANKRTTAR
jgi:hypothetical protein